MNERPQFHLLQAQEAATVFNAAWVDYHFNPKGLRQETSPRGDATPLGLGAFSAGTQGSARRATLG